MRWRAKAIKEQGKTGWNECKACLKRGNLLPKKIPGRLLLPGRTMKGNPLKDILSDCI
jgi:hypothetical protein